MRIDWSAPWLAELASAGLRAEQHIEQGVSAGLQAALWQMPAALRPNIAFVEQAQMPATQSYEHFIWQTRQIPTRDNLHDFFNGLIWLHLPKLKRRFNQWHIEAMQGASSAAPNHPTPPTNHPQPRQQLDQTTHCQAFSHCQRGPLRDALTLLDESGALLYCSDALWQALQNHDWTTLFWSQRQDWQHAQLLLLGHALLEKLTQPRKNICAHVLRVNAPWQNLAQLDTQLSNELQASVLQDKPFQPLPVLGVPGWCPQNLDPAFYQDPKVFRALHSQTAKPHQR